MYKYIHIYFFQLQCETCCYTYDKHFFFVNCHFLENNQMELGFETKSVFARCVSTNQCQLLMFSRLTFYVVSKIYT